MSHYREDNETWTKKIYSQPIPLYKYQKKKENQDRLMGHGRLSVSQAKMGSELGDYGMARILQYL